VASDWRDIRTSIIVSFDALSFVKRPKPVFLENISTLLYFKNTFNWCGKPDIRTEFLAISDMSTELSFHTWQATEYSSISGSFVRWNCRGSSVERAIFWPLSKNSKKGSKYENLRHPTFEGRLWIWKEQMVVRHGRHGNANLTQIVKVFHHWRFSQVDAVINIFRQEEGRRCMINVASFAAVRPESKCVHPAFLSDLIDYWIQKVIRTNDIKMTQVHEQPS